MKIKPKTLQVNIHIEAGDSLDGVWDKNKQSLEFRVKRDGKTISAKKVERTIYYDRPNKPKILNRVEFKKSSDFTVSSSEVLTQFEQVWAIDTNQREIFSKNANVSAVTVCSTNGNEDYYPVLGIIFGEVSGNPELVGWRKFIEYSMASSNYNSSSKYGLIVDSELGNISRYNESKLPIHGEFYLPENWVLIYATDSGKKDILNKLISTSDKVSSYVLTRVSELPSNVKYWEKVKNEEVFEPAFLPIFEEKG